MKEKRCNNCGSLLCKSNHKEGDVEIKCRKCGTTNMFKGKSEQELSKVK